MQITNISDVKANLSYLIKTVQETNQSVVIGKAGKPVAILSAFKENKFPRQLGGSWEGNVEISNDFNDTDEETFDRFYNLPIFPE
ncbi:MAG: hypothetical protein B6I31_00580 [Desulfobacteraceae bacterium 4572_19]|nr:MAG: hypothetical protein B6I31_00580 [Desulfobacteraceae bacterium 4572_19]